MTDTKKAARTRLAPGEHSIDRVTAKPTASGGQMIEWSVRLHDGRLIAGKRTQARTAGDARAKARRIADELLAAGGGDWKRSSRIVDYLDQVTKPAIENNARLRVNSRDRYLNVLPYIREALDGHVIDTAMKFRTLEKALQTIATEHGSETARQCRGVISKYVVAELIRDDVLAGSPLAGVTIDLGSVKKSNKPAGGQALSVDDYGRVLAHLLALDPADGIERPKAGPYTLDHRIAVRRNAIDMMLLQATTGLRSSEARQITWDLVGGGADGRMTVTVTEQISKTKKARTVPVLDAAVSEHLLARRTTIGGDYVIGAPTDPTKVWDKANAQKAARTLYRQIGDALDVDLLRTHLTHLWRTTLNTLLIDVLPAEVRAAYFGHDVVQNQRSYTDVGTAMIAAADRLGSTVRTTVSEPDTP